LDVKKHNFLSGFVFSRAVAGIPQFEDLGENAPNESDSSICNGNFFHN